MSNRSGGTTASPFVVTDPNTWFFNSGMHMRQYYKAAALQGLLASGPHDCNAHELVHDAALFADAMIAEDEAWEKRQELSK